MSGGWWWLPDLPEPPRIAKLAIVAIFAARDAP